MKIKRSSMAVAALAALGIGGVAAAPPASAWSQDRPKITDAGIDFGTNWDTFGAPLNGGYLDWNTSGGVVTPHLTGNLYLKNSNGTCARMRIEYFDASHVAIATRNGGTVCATSNALHTFSVNLQPFGASNVFHVHISTTVETTPGTFVVVGTAIEDI